MAVRQYIGARYTLKVYTNSQNAGSAEWEANTNYEPLTMVTYHSASYVSRVAVPPTVGNPTQNPTYWALFGELNGQIANLQSEIDDINDYIGDGTLPNNNETIVDAINYVNRPYEYAVWIGDSFVGAASLPSADRNKRYSTQVSSLLGLTEKNYAVGGTGFIVGPTTNSMQLDNAINDFNSNNLDKTAVQYVFIGGFKNDGQIGLRDKDNYVDAVKQCITKIKNNFVNAKTVIIPTSSCFFLQDYFLDSINFIYEACEDEGDKVIILNDAYKWLVGRFNEIMYQNGVNVHPTIKGHTILANKVYNELNGIAQPICVARDMWIDGWNTNILATGTYQSGFISKADGMMHIWIRFKINSNSYTGTQEIFNYVRNSLFSCDGFYIGPTQLRGKLMTRYTTDYSNVPMFVLEQTVNKTGDEAGTMTTTLSCYGGTLEADQTYVAEIWARDAVDSSSNPSILTT